MSMYVNKVIIQGRLGSDPEFKKGKTEHGFIILSVATSEKYKNKEGKEIENTEWHKVVIFKPDFVLLAKSSLKKGDLVSIIGSLSTEKWEEQGITKYRTQIEVKNFSHFLELIKPEVKAEIKRSGKDEMVSVGEVVKEMTARNE